MRPENLFATILFGGGGAALIILALVLAPTVVPPTGTVRYPELPDSPQCSRLSVPSPPGINPPACDDGWQADHMSDVAKNCAKPGHGRPWCR